MLHWLALNLSEALSFRSSHVSLSTWVSRPASLSRSLRGSQTNYATTDCAALLRSARLTIGWHPSQICLQEGLVRLAEWHRYRHTYRVIRRRDPLAGDLSRRSKPGQARNLAGSGPQLAYKQRKAGLTWCAGRWGQTQRFRFCPRPAWVMPQLRTRCRCPIPLETLERTIGEAKTSRIMRGKFVVK
jgi:hypothetical protein